MAVMSGPPNCSELKLQTNLYTLDPGPLLQIIAAAIVLPASSFAFQAEQWHVTEHHILWYPNMSGCTFQVGSHSSLNFEDDHLVFYHLHWIAVMLQSWMWDHQSLLLPELNHSFWQNLIVSYIFAHLRMSTKSQIYHKMMKMIFIQLLGVQTLRRTSS